MFKKDFLFIPIATINLRVGSQLSYYGFTDIFIFGLRVIRIHRTLPWE
jgi:hypothetical protein